MIKLDLRRKDSGVPILSREEIDDLAFNVLADFDYTLLMEPKELDIDLFAQEYLGMDQDFQFLSHNGIYMGMTIFNDTDNLPVYDPVKRRAEYVSEKANTIVIDNTLLEDDKEHQYRFTMGHECIHGMLHKAFFSMLPGQLTMFDQLGPEFSEPMIRCRVVTAGRTNWNYRDWTSIDWMEWQANAGASAFLMPAPAVKILSEKAHGYGYWGMTYAKVMVAEMMKVFNVSHSAAAFRLKSLNLLDPIIEVTPGGGLTYRENLKRYKR